MLQAREHCAANAEVHAAPVFCVTALSGKYAIYFPETSSEVCRPSSDDVECFAPMLGCQPCSSPIRIMGSDKEGWNFDLRGIDEVYSLDKTGWKWLTAVTTENACNA